MLATIRSIFASFNICLARLQAVAIRTRYCLPSRLREIVCVRFGDDDLHAEGVGDRLVQPVTVEGFADVAGGFGRLGPGYRVLVGVRREEHHRRTEAPADEKVCR